MSKELMTPYSRMIGAFEGKPIDRVPVAPIVREWSARQVGFTFSELMNSASKQVFAQYYCAKIFGTDALWDLWGIHAEAEAMGSFLNIPEDGRPFIEIPLIKNYVEDLTRMRLVNPYKDGRLPLILDGIRQLKDISGGRYPVLGYVNAPFRLASILRGSDLLLKDIELGEAYLEDFLSFCTDALIIYGTAVAQAGADIVWVSDPTSSGDKVSKETWVKYGLPYAKRLITSLKKNRVYVFMHMCGDTNDRLDTFLETGVDGMSLSEKVDLAYAREIMGDDIVILGNVDLKSENAFSTPTQIEEQARMGIEKGRGKKGKFVLSSGCMTLGDVPPENIKALVSAARKYGQY
jgi:uroporphyrinogen decarboxylase